MAQPPINRLIVGALVALIALHVLHVLRYNFVSDDAFISLRYAANLLAGHGLVFNLGERVEGFTSPLWTLLLAGFGACGFDLLEAARALGLLCSILTLPTTYWLARQCGAAPLTALIAPALLAFNGSFACWAASGMETALFVGLIAAAFAAALAGSYWASASLTAAATLARPEGLLVLLVLGGYQLLRAKNSAVVSVFDAGPIPPAPFPTRKGGAAAVPPFLAGRGARGVGPTPTTDSKRGEGRSRLPWLLVSSGPYALYLGFRRWYYGDWLPNTYYAKTGGGWAQIQRGLDYLRDYAADHEGLLLLVGLALFVLLRRPAGMRLVAVGWFLFWLAIAWLGGDGLPMYRFALAPLPLFAALAAACVSDLGQPFLATRKSGIALAVVLGCAWAYTHWSPPRLKSHYGAYQFQQQVEIPRWTQVGQWFAASAPAGASIAVVPIGAVAYYSKLEVRDMLGLTDRHIARRNLSGLGRGWAGHEKHDGQYVLQRRPTYLLLGNVDVTEQPRDPRKRPFIPYDNPHIWAREQDMFATERIFDRYQPRSVQFAPGQYLNFYELKPEFRQP